MASDVVTLALDGAPTLDDLAEALGGLRELLDGLTQPTTERITWVVDGLSTGSAIASFRGISGDNARVSQIAHDYLDLGTQIALGQRQFNPPTIDRAVRRLTGLLNERVPSLRFETADDDVTISSVPAKVTSPPPGPGTPGGFGAVLGRIQTLSNRGSLRFTIYDTLHDKAVSCYLQDGQQDMIRDMWDRFAIVRGWVKRDPATGRPVTVRRVRSVKPRDEGHPNDYLAVGGLLSEAADEPAEAIIRRLRDAQ